MKYTSVDLMNVWNACRGSMRICAGLDIRDRRNLAEARLLQVPDLTRWAAAAKRAAASTYCTGETGNPTSTTGEMFIGNFDWFIRSDTLQLIEEGNYDAARVVEPPNSIAPKDLSYWNEPKPVYTITDDEFLRAQIVGRLQRVKELATQEKSSAKAGDFNYNWVLNGGPHPWAAPVQIEQATAEVMKMRREGLLPAGQREFNPSNLLSMAQWALANPKKALPPGAISPGQFKEFHRLKTSLEQDAPIEAAPPDDVPF